MADRWGAPAPGAPLVSTPLQVVVVTPHVQREWGKVIVVGVDIYVYIYNMFVDQNKFEWYFSDRLTFSNICGSFLVEFIELLYHCFLQKQFVRQVNQRFSYIMRTLLDLSGWMTQLPVQMHR